MKANKLPLEGAWVIDLELHEDSRGSFHESFRADLLEKLTGFAFDVKQVNQSYSKLGVIRGIHYSNVHNGQAKYVGCTKGRIMDFIVDLRLDSATFGRSIQLELSQDNYRAVLISPGLGHGYLSLEHDTAVSYLCNEFYNPNNEFGLNPLDPALDLDVLAKLKENGLSGPILSDKDSSALTLAQAKDRGLLPFSLKG